MSVLPVYPRLRGERSHRDFLLLGVSGLSPASRGTLSCCKTGTRAKRFIPGFAGNALSRSGNIVTATVYPRLRGERALSKLIQVKVSGLSPASRGTHQQRHRPSCIQRFIPGFAGNAIKRMVGRNGPTVYPRLRGERIFSYGKCRAYNGLSPASRGTPSACLSRCLSVRFIPGFAGNAS